MSVWILLFIFLVCSVPCRAENYVLRSNITTSKCLANATVAFWCNVNSMITGNEDVLWYRKVGDSKQVLGLSSMLSVEFYEGRYKISLSKKTQTSVTYELIISSAKLQDSATVQCVSPTSKQVTSANSFSLAVCDNLNSSFCNCIAAEGWASPNCNKVVEAAKAKKYESQRGCIGIAVCLAFMLAVALILTVLLIVNEVRSHSERERDRQAQKAHIEEENQIKFDQPSGPSILKRTKTNQEWNQPQIDPFSMSQLQQVPFHKLVAASPQSGPGFPQQKNKSNTSNSAPQAFSNTSNLQAIPRKGDVKYSDNFHNQYVQQVVASNGRGAESQI